MTLAGTYAADWTNSISRKVPWLRFLLIGLAAVAAVLAGQFLVVIPYGRAIGDYLFLLDGAYRISLGQLPHLDFQSPIGSLSLYLIYLAERLFPSGNPFVGMHVLAWLLVLPPFALIAPRFRSVGGFAVAFALLGLMVVVPVTLDSTHLSEISYFASYNRFATGLLFLASLWFVLPKGRSDALFLGYLLLVLFFLKITAALVVGGIVVAAVVLGRANWRVAALAVLLATVGCAAIEGVSGLVSAYVGGTVEMMAVNKGRAIYLLLFAAFRNWAVLAALAALVFVILATPGGLRQPTGDGFASIRELLERHRLALDSILLVGAALLAESQNTGGLGLIAASALLFHSDAWSNEKLRGYGIALLVTASVLPVLDVVVKRSFTAFTRERVAVADPLINDVLPGTRVPDSTAAGARLFDAMTDKLMDAAIDAQAARFFVDPDPTSYAPAARLAWTNQAVEAARAFEVAGYRGLAASYTTLAFSDPFMRLLKLAPARNTTIAIEIGRTMPLFDEAGASDYLATSEGVFFPRCEVTTGDGNERVFEAVLDVEFDRKPLNRCWDFYHRVKTSGVRR